MFQISIRPPGFDSTYQRLLNGDPDTGQKGLPAGTFYLKGAVVVPFTPEPTTFQLDTDAVGTGVTVNVIELGQTAGIDNITKKTTISHVANENRSLFRANLGRGRNVVQVKENVPNGRLATIIVEATNYSTFLHAYSREMYNDAQVLLDAQSQAIFNDYSTRLVDNLLDFQELLPEVQSLQIMANKFAIRTLVHQPGSQIGTLDFATALTQSTPIFEKTRNQFDFEPLIRTLYNSQEDFAGVNAHVWLPNLAVTRWVAFIKLVNNLSQIFSVEKVTEDEVVINFMGEQQTHRFESDTLGASSINFGATEECFTAIRVLLEIISQTYINICAAGYTHDLFVEKCNPLGETRVTLDTECPIPLDSGYLDNEYTDPYTTGHLGLSLTGRFEGESYPLGWDTFVQPSPTWPGPTCVYPHGYYTQQINNNYCEIDILAVP